MWSIAGDTGRNKKNKMSHMGQSKVPGEVSIFCRNATTVAKDKPFVMNKWKTMFYFQITERLSAFYMREIKIFID